MPETSVRISFGGIPASFAPCGLVAHPVGGVAVLSIASRSDFCAQKSKNAMDFHKESMV